MASFPFSIGLGRATRPTRASSTATVDQGNKARPNAAVKPQPAPVVPSPVDAPARPLEGRELRSDPRRDTSHPAITGIRLSPYGVEATLINISSTGVLVRCSTRFKPETAVTVVFQGTFTPSSVQGRVARSVVAAADKQGILWYDVGIAFDTRIALDDAPATRPEPEPPALTVVDETPEAPDLVNRW